MNETLQRELRALFEKLKMPSSPTLAAQILERAEDPNSTIEQFAELIQLDPALSARLLSMTNSAACAQRSQVTTIQRAVTILGLNRVRTISLGFQLVSHLDRLGNCPFDMKLFWQQSLLRGCLSRVITEQVLPSRAEEAFLVGLLQDSGILLLVQMLGQPYAEFHQSNTLAPGASFEAERGRFKYDHVQMIAVLGREWKLPTPIVSQLEAQHTAASERPADEDATMAAVSFVTGSIALSATDCSSTACDAALASYAADMLGLGETDLQHCLSQAAAAYAELGHLLQGIVPDNLDVTDLLGQANIHLARSFEQQRMQSEREQERLQHTLGAYQERAARDPLTNVLNRGALNDAARSTAEKAAADGEALTVIFLDLDNFKQLNDLHGHACGDRVLQSVAQALKQQVTHGGIVGRYGGEEFVTLVRGIDAAAARHLGDALVAAVRQITVPDADLPVTCSAGVIWSMTATSVDALIADADSLMYEAKCAGKNRACFRDYAQTRPAPNDTPQNSPIELLGNPGHTACQPLAVEVFERIAHQLNRETRQTFVDGRKQQRKPLIHPCTLTLLNQATLKLTVESAYLRNISTGGIGLLTQRAVTRGEAVEVAIEMGGRPTYYAAGVVAFCRHIEGLVHEVGLQLFAHGKAPILSHDPIGAIQNLDWAAGLIAAVQTPPTSKTAGELDESVRTDAHKT